MKITQAESRKIIVGLILIGIALGCETDGTDDQPEPSIDATILDAQPEVVPSFESLASVANYEESTAGHVSLRRLTRAQYKNAIKALFGPDIDVPKVLEPDVPKAGLRNVGASQVSYSPRGVESIEAASFAISDQIVASPSILDQVFPCEGTNDEACLDEALTSLITRVYRRPPNTDEVDRTKRLIRAANETLNDMKQAYSFGIAALLIPHFLFELNLVPNSDEREFSSYEMASRLNCLWNTIPDTALFELAAEDGLKTRRQVYDVAKRMMESDKFRQGLRAYFEDSLELYELDHLSKDPKVFEHFDPELGPAAAEETWRLIENLVFDEPRDFRDIMTADFTFVNPRLATIYGVPSPVESGFGFLPWHPDDQRSGLLGQVSFLALHSHSTATSATRRGEAVRTRLLCQEIPSPPVNVDTSIPEPTGTRRTLRERVAEHLSDPSCVGCHQLTDPIGLGLENYDSIGRFRYTDNDANIDPSGELDGEPFETPVELGQRLRSHPSYAPCIIQKIVEYGIGRELVSSERTWFRALTDRFSIHGYLLQPMILEFVTSPVFMRPGAPLEDSE